MNDQAKPEINQPIRWKARYAAFAEIAGKRLHGVEDDPHRSPFQRDRDRVIHAAAFRRLQYKTQVFVFHEGDHYRTRMTHTLEVAQVARSLARDLQLDEDLTEVAALAHDLGHPPFGHAGERALNRAMVDFGGFDHNAQSLRVVMELEKRYGGFDGLNLCQLSLDSLAKHNGPVPEDERQKPFWQRFAKQTGIDLSSFGVLEAQVAAISDDVAYNAHDVEDGLRSGLLTLEKLKTVPLLAEVLAEIEQDFPNLEPRKIRYEITRRLITRSIRDVSLTLQASLTDLQPESATAVTQYNKQMVRFSPEMQEQMMALKAFLFKQLYRHPRVSQIMQDAERVLVDLFELHFKKPQLLPPEWHKRHQASTKQQQARLICDYIAGMTDRFALQKHAELFDDTPYLR